MAALGFLGGIQPGGLGAQNIQTVMGLGQQMNENQGQQKALELETNAREIMRTQGPEAARKYLTEAVRGTGINPKNMRAVQDKIEKLEAQGNASKAAAMMQDKDPKVQLEGQQLAFKSMEPKDAAALVKALMPEAKLYTLGAEQSLVDATGHVIKKGEASTTMKVSDLGGQDVTNEVTKLWGEGGIKDFLTKLGQGDPTAIATHQEAVRLAQARQDEDKAKGRKAMTDAASIQAAGDKAMAQAIGREKGSALEPTIQKNLLEMEDMWNVAQDIKETYDPKFSGQMKGRIGEVRQILGMPYQNEAEFRQSTISLLNQRIKNMSGTAVSVQEGARLQAEMPVVTDEPKVFESKLNNVIKRLERNYESSFEMATTPRGQLKRKKLSAGDGKKITPGGREVIE
jgi:hypothetical protein